jgi:hypothetical protein
MGRTGQIWEGFGGLGGKKERTPGIRERENENEGNLQVKLEKEKGAWW